MKNKIMKKSFEKGQVLIFVVLVIFALIAMVALILDGGDIMSNRRTAQAAADSGALAGAQHICMGKPNPIGAAESYALTNGANIAFVSRNGQEITVNATVENESFFAKIFNEDNLIASADATAGCYYPSIATRVLPISFYYGSPPVKADEIDCKEDDSCEIVNWNFEELMTDLRTTPVVDVGSMTANQPFDDIYVISNSIKVCEKDYTGAIVCSDMSVTAGGGARTFIDLTVLKAPPANLKDIIEDGLDDPIHLPAWVNVQDGVNTDVYNPSIYEDFDGILGYEDVEARLFFVPVYDIFCEEDPELNCSTNLNDHFEYLVNEIQPSYRLVGFAPFVVTGVTKNEVCSFGEFIPEGTWNLGSYSVEIKKNFEQCPGYAVYKAQLDAYNEGKPPQDQMDVSKDAIEGYFVDNIPADQYVWGTGGVDVGIYLISLSN